MRIRNTPIGRAVERRFWSGQSAIWDQAIESDPHRCRVDGLVCWVGSALGERSRVLDLGCATGEIAIRLADLGHHVCAVDLSPDMLQRAKRKPGSEAVRFVEADLAEALPESLGTFDAVLLLGLLQCVPDPQRVVSDAAAHLAWGGSLFVEVKGLPEGTLRRSSGASLKELVLRAMKTSASRSAWVHRFDMRKLASMLTTAGLEVETVEAPVPWLRLIGHVDSAG